MAQVIGRGEDKAYASIVREYAAAKVGPSICHSMMREYANRAGEAKGLQKLVRESTPGGGSCWQAVLYCTAAQSASLNTPTQAYLRALVDNLTSYS
jgi:hypothetical protein